ncbi:uncharacterized protein E5676_scaffold494G00120 [Cucumis melo var. makuwa]|uniref:DUF4218 domain-containing protein n=1 Tax=Cucumis melo var. makuwa TaxID=1194695 RepID=A0A5D3DEV9_CUCMM|nr:uncharacterized protein E5676_scaffold494G00120 [Cucumis melo var. makuwa]
MFLELLNEAFSNGVKLPVSYYEAKKRLRDLGMRYKSIHVCKFDCALFWKDYASLDKCPHCGESRYRLNDRKGILRHPADAEGWKHFDEQYPCFTSDARNVRLALSSDGFNPFGNMSISYSMWPVILIPYNLPPWKYELNELWVDGIQTYDSFSASFFQLRAALFRTINDFPAYGDLSGWRTKGMILNIDGKTKDTIKAREDLAKLKVRKELHIQEIGNKRVKPHASYTLTAAEKVDFSVHLPWEARIVGPVGYSWMYPIERSLHYLKKYVRNKARPEGSIAEAYVINESLNFCSMYLRGIETRFNRGDRNNDDIDDEEINNCGLSIFSQHIRWLGGAVFRQLTPDELEKSHWYILNNCDEVKPYLQEHMRILESSNGNGDLYKRQQLEFPTWFKAKAQRLHCDKFISDDLYALACGPNDCARSYSGLRKNRINIVDGFTSINTRNRWYKDEHFILVSQAAQVFYVDDYKLGQDWKIVQKMQPRHVWDIPEIESNELEVTSDETISTCYPRVEHNLDSQIFNREDVEPSIIGDQEDIIAQSNEEASTDEALVDEEYFDSNNSSDESMSDEDCDSY